MNNREKVLPVTRGANVGHLIRELLQIFFHDKRRQKWSFRMLRQKPTQVFP